MTDDQTYSQRLARRMEQERVEFENDRIARAQAEIDFWWQTKIDLEGPLDDGYVEIAGFREPRRRTTCSTWTRAERYSPIFGGETPCTSPPIAQTRSRGASSAAAP
jgi:hypothetical protein